MIDYNKPVWLVIYDDPALKEPKRLLANKVEALHSIYKNAASVTVLPKVWLLRFNGRSSAVSKPSVRKIRRADLRYEISKVMPLDISSDVRKTLLKMFSEP